MQFIKVQDDIVTGIFAGSSVMDGMREVPANHQLLTGTKLSEYDQDYQLLPLSERVARGVVEVPRSKKLEGDEFVEMTEVEQIKAGLVEPSLGMKIKGDELVEMSIDEQITAGQISRDEANERLAREIRDKRNNLLAECDYIMMPDYPTFDNSKWIAYRQALRDVPEQKDFPESIRWPMKPPSPFNRVEKVVIAKER